MAEAKTLPSGWWADNDGKAMWLRRHDANNQDELFWCDDAGADYLNDLEAQVALLDEALRDVLFESNNMHVHEVHNRKRPDVSAFCIKVRDIAAEVLARISPSLTP